MTISGTMHPIRQEVVPEGKRLRMKDWLKSRIGDPKYPGLVWLDEEKQTFRIPWKHAALHGWDQNSDGALFRDWAEHTGACLRNAHPKQLKATFRCALHSLPDVHEDKAKAKKKGDGACRVYKFDSSSSTAPKRRHIRIRNHKENERTHGTNASKISRVESTLLSTQYADTAFPDWNSSIPHNLFAPNSNNNCNSPTSFSTTAKDFPLCEYPSQERQWTTRSEPNIPHGLFQPTVNLPHQHVDAPCFYSDTPMQHSESVPNFSPTYFSETQSSCYNTAAHKAGMQHYCAIPPFESGDGGNFSSCPLSPHNADYNSTHSVSSPLRSPDVSDMNCVNIFGTPSDSSRASTGVTSPGCHARFDFQPEADFSTTQQLIAAPLFEEKFLDALDNIVSCGTLQQVATSAACHMSTPGAAAGPKNFKNFQLGLQWQPDEGCQSSFLLDQPSNEQALTTITPMQRYSSHSREYIDNQASPIDQYAIEPAIMERHTQEWMSSPPHESLLPSASTLLAPTSSSTERRMPLRWTSVDDDAMSPPMNYELLQHCDAFPEMPDSFCDFDALTSDQ